MHKIFTFSPLSIFFFFFLFEFVYHCPFRGILISLLLFQAFPVPQDHLDHLVQELLKETGETLDFQAFPAPLAEKENLEALEAMELLVLLDLKVRCQAVWTLNEEGNQ